MKYVSSLILTLVLVSCGTKGDYFTLEGRLLNLNQGEFYVYSTDGVIDAIDTIHVAAGRFSYKTKCTQPGTLVIVFPNFSEQPVFAMPGKSVNLEGDAYKLKGIKVKGTDDNKLMNRFREQIESASPQEIKHAVQLFVSNHPQSIVSIYLVRRYFIVCQTPDYNGAATLLAKIMEAQPENGRLKVLFNQVDGIAKVTVGKRLPAFSVKTIKGDVMTQKNFSKGDAIIYTWSTWEFESYTTLQYIDRLSDGKVKSLGICLDASAKACRKWIDRENIKIPVSCDEKMFEGKAIQQLGLYSIPTNIIIRNGKIVARDLTSSEIRERFKQDTP